MSDTELLQTLGGTIVPRNFSPGYVVLSYVVSYIGSWTTLELINKRTAGRGLYNWYLLIGSSISMGGIAIWCMHYVGNRAIIISNGDDLLQIAYNPGFTALSFFVPILVLLAAFMAVGTNDKVSIIRVTLGGALAGLAICGMHYLGQAGISNYTCEYQVGNVIGSGVIAIVASITALSVFFVLRATWTNSWWKRAATAIILAGAVSGMHWLASVGTQYRLKQVDNSQGQNLSRNSTVIVVIVLSIASCFILLALSLLAQLSRNRSANRAQQVVLAAAVFDKDGKIMVTAGGLLPNQKITNTYVERSFDDVFGISHPVFLWIFRTTRNWSGVGSLLPAMRNHIQHTSMTRGSRPGARSNEPALTNEDGEPVEDYSVIFRELFCVAAADLADQLNEPLENLGVLYDEILSTGQSQKPKPVPRKILSDDAMDVEREGVTPPAFGRGQLLFLVRRTNRRESEHLQAAGYRFAGIQNVSEILARSMQINCDDLTRQLVVMREYATKTNILEPGVHLACFAIRASVRGAFDVLVRQDAKNQLPTMQMPLESLEAWHLDYLSQLDSWTVSACIKFFQSKASSATIPKKEQMFASQLYDTLEALCEELNDPFFMDAMLVAKPVTAPCRGLGEDAVPGACQLIAFRLIVPIHSRTPGQKLQFNPLSFFKMQQHIYENSPDHEVFARKIHREFGPVLNQAKADMATKGGTIASTFRNGMQGGRTMSMLNMRDRIAPVPPAAGRRGLGKPDLPQSPQSGFRFWDRKSTDSRTLRSMKSSDASSEKNLVESQSFGGIMVSQEVTVDIREYVEPETPGLDKRSTDDATEMVELGSPRAEELRQKHSSLQMGTVGGASKENEDPETYVNRLFAVCVENRR